MWSSAPRVGTLVIGYGNPGRQDDGLGPACALHLAALGLPDVCVESNYQLVVEDALQLTGFDRVVFVDASMNGQAPFSIVPVSPDEHGPLGSHGLSPEAVVTLARTLFHATADAYLLGIRGYAFDTFAEILSPGAKNNLDQALRYLENWLRSDTAAGARPHVPQNSISVTHYQCDFSSIPGSGSVANACTCAARNKTKQ